MSRYSVLARLRVAALVTGLFVGASEAQAQQPFIRGDCNADASVQISDPVTLLDFLFSPGFTLVCDAACDANADGDVDIADAIYMLGYLFVPGSPVIPAPFPECGTDLPSSSCDSFPPCPITLVPTVLAAVSGDGQSGFGGGPLADPLVVEVLDQFGDPLPGVAVTFAIVTGGGSIVEPQPISTDVVGRAAATWVLGSIGGRQQVSATVAPLPVVSFVALADTIDIPEQEVPHDDGDSDAVAMVGHVTLPHGEVRLDRSDFMIQGRGHAHFAWNRRYRSRALDDGPLGRGWSFNYGDRLEILSGGDVVRHNGYGHSDTWLRQPDDSFVAPVGHFGMLVAQLDGMFVHRAPDGYKRFYLADGRLDRCEDRFGHTVGLFYDGSDRLDLIVDAYGREIEVVFELAPDGVERITRVIDYAGREVVYGYDSSGRLVSTRTPIVVDTSIGNDFPDGRTEQYSYDGDHRLLTVTFPQEVEVGGPPALSWTYGTDPADSLTLGRALSETEGGINASAVMAGGTRTFSYQVVNSATPPGSPGLVRWTVFETQRNGTLIEHDFDERGHRVATRELTLGLRPGEPANYATLFEYDADGQLVRQVNPEGNEVLRTYDAPGPRAAQQNVIELRLVAGPRGGGEDLVETYTYEPLYQQLATRVDARATASAFVPPLGVASEERYTTRWTFDYQESTLPVSDATEFDIDLSSIVRGLGDRNADGVIDQRFGNRVRLDEPTVTLEAGSELALRLGATSQEIVTELQWNDSGQIAAIIDPEGNVTRAEYYPENDPDGDGVLTVASTATLTNDPLGYPAVITVDAADSARRTATEPPTMLTTESRYDVVGNVIWTRNPRGVAHSFEVNALNETVTVTRGADVSLATSSGELVTGESAFAYTTRFTRDHNGRLVLQEVENRDLTTPGVGAFVDLTRTVDLLGNLVASTVEVDATTVLTTTFEYDPNELLSVVERPEGDRTVFTYDERNLPFEITRGSGSPAAATTRFDYDLNGNVLRLVDAEDNDGDGEPEATIHTYDGFDRPVVITDALGNQIVSTYDAASNVVRRQRLGHPAGQPAAAPVPLSDFEFHIDELGRVYRADQDLFLAAGFSPTNPVTLLDGNSDGVVSSRVERDALSRVVFVVEDDGQVHETIYDGASRPIARIDALQNRIERVYDRNSNVIEEHAFEVSADGLLDEQEYVRFSSYDQLDRIVRVSADHTQRYGYDSRDNLISISDAKGDVIPDPLGFYPGETNEPGNTITRLFDGRDRLTSEILDVRIGGVGGQPLDFSNPFNPDGQIVVDFDYDANSRLTQLTDDAGNTTGYVYDPLDRLVQKLYADASFESYVYDRDGNLVQFTDANGTVVNTVFDVLDRAKTRSVIAASGVVGVSSESYEYDGMSRLTRADSAAGAVHTVERVYDSLARTLEERQGLAVCSSVYAGDARVLSTTYPGGRAIESDYDATDRLKERTDGGLALGSFFWFGPSGSMSGDRLLHRDHGNGTALTHLNDTADEDIGHDSFKRVTVLRHVDGLGAAFVNREYQYDRAHRRTLERRVEDSSLEDQFTFDSAYRVTDAQYDQGGGAAAVPRDLQSTAYEYDGVGNRREVQDVTGSSGAVTTTHTVNAVNEYTAIAGGARVHDLNGNLVDDGGRLFAYDYRNRLVEVTRKSDSAPIASYEYDALNRRVRRVVFDLGTPGLVVRDVRYLYDTEFRVIEEVGPAGTEVTYVYGRGSDEPIQMVRTTFHPEGAGTFYFHPDARGDVVAVTDSTGSVVERTVYQDFGTPAQSLSIANPYLFQGRRYDFETGLYYFRYRHYDPSTGRFLQRDPVHDPSNVGNPYTFAGNDPLTESDPFGLRGKPPVRPQSSLTWGEWWGGFWGSLTEDSWAARAHKEEREHLERSIDLLMEDGHSPTAAFFLTIGLAISDTGGTTELHEAYENYDITDFVASGNIRRLSTAERCLKGAAGLLKLVTAGLQGSQLLRASRVAALELRAGSRAAVEFFTFGRSFLVKAADGSMRQGVYRALSGHGSMTGKFFRLPPNANVTVRFHGKAGQTITDQFGRVVDVGGSAGRYVYTGRGAVIPEHILHAPKGLQIVVGNQTYMVKGSRKLSEIIAELVAKNPGDDILIDWAACRSPDTILAAGRALNQLMLTAEIQLETIIDMIKLEDPVTAEAIADAFDMAPGMVNSGDVSANDTAPPGPVVYELVTPPALDPSLFSFNPNGTFEVSPLTFGGPLVTFQYKMVYSGGETDPTDVTVNVVPSVAYVLQPFTDPVTMEESVAVPCVVIGGLHYPIYQFILGNSPFDSCSPPHWHSFGDVFPLESPMIGISDPNPPGCGYGLQVVIPQANFVVTVADWSEFLFQHIPAL